MMLVLSKALVFLVMMSPCIGSSIEGNCSITSIDYCDDVFNSSRGFAHLGLRCDFTASTEDHIVKRGCSAIAKGNNYEIRGDSVERVEQSCVDLQPSPVSYAFVQDSVFFCDVSNCKKSTYCNNESTVSTCLCYDSATIEHPLHEFL